MSDNALQAEVSERRVRFTIDESIYALDVIMGAAYLFIDKAYVFLDRAADRQVVVALRARGPASAEELESLSGQFANELLNQALRKQIGESNGRLREYILARALFAAEGPSTIDKLLAELDAEEMASDDLDIPVPWEKPTND